MPNQSARSLCRARRGCGHIGQVWAFCASIAPGDWFALPSKFASTIHFGEITGPLRFDTKVRPPFKHYRTCKWIARDVPRSRFDRDLLYSLGAFLTIGAGSDRERRTEFHDK